MLELTMRSALSAASRIDKVACLHEAYERVRRGDVLAPPTPAAMSPPQFANIVEELKAMRQRRTKELLKRYKTERPVAANLLEILKEASIARRDNEIRQGTGFGLPEVDSFLTEKLDGMLRSGQPITFAMITGGLKIQNAVKVGRTVYPEIADWITVNHLQAFADAMALAANHPVKVVLVADGHLHTGDAGLDPGLAEVFLDTLRHDTAQLLGITDVILGSPLPHLDDRWYQYLLDEVRKVRRGAAVDPVFSLQLAEQAEALVSSINLRSRGWSYAHTVAVFATVAGYPTDALATRDAEDLRRLALLVSCGYTATNHAVRDLSLVERVVQRETGHNLFIRTSVHAKRFEPRLALAPSNAMSRHYLLPMHSLGRLETMPDGRLAYGPLFDIEARMGGMDLLGFRDDRLQRVRPLFFRANAVHSI